MRLDQQLLQWCRKEIYLTTFCYDVSSVHVEFELCSVPEPVLVLVVLFKLLLGMLPAEV